MHIDVAILTMRRYASKLYAIVVCLGVSYAWYYMKTAKCGIMQTMPYDRQGGI